MATASRPTTIGRAAARRWQRPVRTSRRLFLHVLGLFLAFGGCFFGFQYQRERGFAAERLSFLLEGYNDRLDQLIQRDGLQPRVIEQFRQSTLQPELRITILDAAGTVFYDSDVAGAWQQVESHREIENHAAREEIVQARTEGTGWAVRESASTHRKYFYAAKAFGELTLRMALPYEPYARRLLAIDRTFVWFMAVMSLLMIGVIYRYTWSLSRVIRKLRGIADRAERKVEAAREVKRQLTHNIAHELKTPVSSIRGFLELILTNPEITPEQKEQFLQRSYAQTERLSLLLQDISLINSLDEAPGMFQIEAVDLGLLVGELVEDCRVDAARRGITVDVHLPRPCVVEGNYSLLYSIFRNLLDNAIQYGGEQIRVEIDCYVEEAEYYRFTFSDSGPGVDPAHLERLFERFYRVDKGRSRKAGGTGLGLSIVKHAVLFHRGTITARNGMLGGLEFEFTLRKRH